MSKFAFIIHPLGIEDIKNNEKSILRYAIPIMGKSEFLYDKLVFPRLEKKCSKKLADITGIVSKTGQTLEGIFVGIPYTAEQIKNAMESSFRDSKMSEEILDSCRMKMYIAKEEGCNIIGLGAYSSIITKGGKLVENDNNIKITTGSTNTTLDAVLAAYKGAEMLETNYLEYPAAVIGGTGSIGELCTILLAEKMKEVRIVGRKEHKLNLSQEKIEEYLKLKNINSKIRIYTDAKKAVNGCKIVVSATSNVSPIFSSREDFESFDSGAVIADVARPTDIDKKIMKYRDDIIVIDSGIDKIPGNPYFGGIDFSFPEGEAYACMAETMMLSLENIQENWTESLTDSLDKRIKRIEFIKKIREKHGFELAALRSFHKPVSEEYVDSIRKNIKK